MRGTAALAALLLAAGCGGSSERPDFQVHGANVLVNSTAAFTRSSDFPQRVETTLDAALRYWGGDWRALEGRTITFEGDRHVRCGNERGAVGCFDGDIRVTTTDVSFTYRCVEETALVHEVGHAVIGDPDHTDPRWMDFSAVQQDLQGRPGYADHGDAACTIFVNVWRRPPDATRTSAASAAPVG